MESSWLMTQNTPASNVMTQVLLLFVNRFSTHRAWNKVCISSLSLSAPANDLFECVQINFPPCNNDSYKWAVQWNAFVCRNIAKGARLYYITDKWKSFFSFLQQHHSRKPANIKHQKWGYFSAAMRASQCNSECKQDISKTYGAVL